jgi:CBS domain containing-hemolysin-like protein
MLGPLLVVVGLVACNAFYVAAEFAAVSVRKSRIRQLAADGHAIARRLSPILESPAELDRYIAACQVGITLSSLVLGAYGQVAFTPGLSRMLGDWLDLEYAASLSTAALVVLVTLTIGQMVIGELVPKSVALQFPTQTALGTHLPMRWSLLALGPFIWLLNGSGNLVLRLFGDEHGAHRHVHSPDEIELLIAESRDGGLLEPEEHRRLQRALRFSRKTAAQLMVSREHVAAISVNTPLDQVLDVALDSRLRRLPVYSGSIDTILGILSVKDLLVRQLEQRPVGDLRELLQPAVRVSADTTGDQLTALLRARHSHQALVEGARGELLGIVTLDNILSELLGPEPADRPRRAGSSRPGRTTP